MYCKKCGGFVEEDQKYCSLCGTKIVYQIAVKNIWILGATYILDEMDSLIQSGLYVIL